MVFLDYSIQFLHVEKKLEAADRQETHSSSATVMQGSSYVFVKCAKAIDWPFDKFSMWNYATEMQDVPMLELFTHLHQKYQ